MTKRITPLLIAVMLLTQMPAYAAASTSSAITTTLSAVSAGTSVAAINVVSGGALTYDDAVTQALGYSKDVQMKAITIGQSRDLRDRMANLVVNAGYTSDSMGSSVLNGPNGMSYVPDSTEKQALLGVTQAQNALIVNNSMYSVAQDSVAFAVWAAFDQIESLQNQITSETENIKVLADKLSLGHTESNLGLKSDFDLTSQMKDLDTEKKNLELLNKSLTAAYSTLNSLLGKPDGSRYILQREVKYEEMAKNTDISGMVLSKKSGDPYIQTLRQSLKNAEASLNMFTLSGGADKSYSERKDDVSIAGKTIDQANLSYDLVFRNRVSQLMQLQDQIKQDQIKLAKAQDTLKLVNTQVSAGLAIATDQEAAQLGVDSTNSDLANLYIKHATLKKTIDKPYLSPTYMQSSSS